jgi:hypothetical protein
MQVIPYVASEELDISNLFEGFSNVELPTGIIWSLLQRRRQMATPPLVDNIQSYQLRRTCVAEFV